MHQTGIMSNTDCNSSIASSTTTTSLGSQDVSKKRLSGIKKFKSKLMRRSKSGGSEQSPGMSNHLRGGSIGSGYEFNTEFDSPQNLPGMIVEDVNVSMETVTDDIMRHDEQMLATLPIDQEYNFANNYSEKSSENDYCPYKSTTQENSPNSQSVEDYINHQMDVAPHSPNWLKASPSSTSPEEPNEMQFSSACGPSPAKLKLLDLSLNDSSVDGVYEEDVGVDDEHDQDELDAHGEDRLKVKADEVYASGVSFINVLPRVAVMDKKKLASDVISDVQDTSAEDGLRDTVEQEITAKYQLDELKNVGRKESIDSKQTTDDEDTFDGWKNVGTQDMDTDGSSVRSSSIDLADGSNSLRSNSVDLTGGKHPSDGFLDEYPMIVDEGKEIDVKSVRFFENKGAASKVPQSTPVAVKQLGDTSAPPSVPLSTPVANRQNTADGISPPTTVSASDCMAQFSSASGPSPVKLKSPHSRDYFNFDISMETSMESSAAELDQSNKEAMDDSTKSDDNINVWNGNGIDIAIDEAGEDSTVNESCTDTDVAADESTSLKDGSTSASASRSDLMSPLTIDGTIQQEQSQHLLSKRSLRQGKKQNSDLPTTTSMLHLEYNVDHSCSTPLERLARDIGNVLRQWNVHNGCDRHVPLDWMEQMEVDDSSDAESCVDNQQELDKSLDTERIEKAVEDEMTIETNQIMSMDLCMNRFANRSRKINEWMGEDTAKMPSDIDVESAPATPVKSIETTKPKQQSELKTTPKICSNTNRESGAQCIRSKKIIFETIGFTPQNRDVSTDESVPSMVWTRRRYSIPLLLSLWDAPPIPTEHNPESCTEDELSCNIPFSLRPDASYSSHALLGELGVISPCGTKRTFFEQSSKTNTESSTSVAFGNISPPLDTGFGRDLSSLFSIGQHITLSLDIDSAQYSSQYNQDSKHLQDIQALYDDIRAYLTDTIEQALEQKALAALERQRRLKRQRKRALKTRNFNATPLTDEYRKHSKDVVPVGSESLSIDVDGEEEVLFDHSDKENKSEQYATAAFDDEHSLSDDDTLMMSLDDELRLNESEIHNEAMSVLSSLVQNAMNLAATENNCCIPVFGLWGSYKGASRDKEHSTQNIFAESGTATSSWIPTATPAAQDQKSKRTVWEGDEAHFKKLILSSPVISGHCQRDWFRSTHRVYSIPRQILPLHLSTLHGLSCVLLAQCQPQTDTNRVMVTSARHCYHMDVSRDNKSDQTWRMAGFTAPHGGSTAIEVYKETCHRQASFLLERASSPWVYKTVPMWGPSEGNPLLSLSASVSWGVVSITNASQEEPDSLFSPTKTPHSAALLHLPLKIRSSNFVTSPSELRDMEYSLQSAAFDPIGTGFESKDGDVHFGPREPIFFASAKFDSDLPCATLSANVRCVLAALLRCGSLGPDALPGHLTRKEILRKLGGPLDVSLDDKDGVIGTMAESDAMLRAGIKHVGPVTTRLVEAMDWAEVGTISTNADVERGIADALQRIGAGGLYPAPPEEIFAQYYNYSDSSATISKCKGSPPGRLLSILFAHMARLRTPPSMMSLWLAFVEELRSRWDSNESLPNLGFVPGLDEDVLCNKQGGTGRVLGHRAHFAAFVNSSEPDPDRNQCIINQKLEVFNICIESKMSVEAMQSDVDEHESMEESGIYSNSDSDEFFDPEEEEVAFESDAGEAQTGTNEIETMLKMEAAAVTNPGISRNGARCPVPDALPLIETGGQVYAPYLQRTMPMTDEEEEKQNRLFGKDKQSNNERLSIRDRIEISQRLQTPKLMSDMSAFKAANPECIFEDFVSWYGNPQNPLSEEVNGESFRRSYELRSNLSPEAAKVLALEEASEAIAILMSLRTFWEDSFEEAEPCPASEQQPLFDPYSTVEMVLHSFETIHPALLMGQALAVNLMSAEFVLETHAKPVNDVPLIAQTLLRIKAAIRDAMEHLTNDASDGCFHASTHKSSDEYPLVHVSALTIQKCEEACDRVGEMELLLSRALTLWQLCPCAELVNSLLQCQGGSFVLLKSPKERNAFLNAIKQHQSTHVGVTSDNQFPEASMREYVIRNGDQDLPCQLNARLVSAMNGEHSALLALTKSSRD